MIYRLRNYKNPHQTLTLTRAAWHRLLEMAVESGWIPMGTIHQNLLHGLSTGTLDELLDGDPGNGTYTPTTSRLVMLEDALNLMDALEQVFLAYEPSRESPYRRVFKTEWDEWSERSRPGIGSLLALAEFCRSGSFVIEARTSPEPQPQLSEIYL